MAKKASVLVVDDNPSTRRTLELVLRREGHHAETAGNAFEGLERVKRNAYDLVFLDIRMPGMDGVEACKAMQEIRPGLDVVMITSYEIDSRTEDALRQVVRDVLHKPLNMAVVLNLVEEAS